MANQLIALCLLLGCLGLCATGARAEEMEHTRRTVARGLDEANIGVFNSPICTHGDSVYVAFVRPDPTDGEGYQTVVARRSGEEWQLSVVEPRSRKDQWHSQPSLCVDRDGYVHVTYNMHSSPWLYSVSKRPEDISEWEFRGQELRGPHDVVQSGYISGPGTAAIPGNRITYQFMTTDRNGVPYVCYREALTTAPGTDYYRMGWSLGVAKYDPDTRQWRRVGPGGGVFPFATQPGFRGQGGSIFFDAANRMHLAWLFYAEYERDGSGHLKPNYPCYARSDDGGETFHKADGAPLSLPVDLPNADVMLQPSWCEPNERGYFSGYTHVGAMPDGTPWVEVMLKDPPPGKGPALVPCVPGEGWGEPMRTPYAGRQFVIDDVGTITVISSGLRVHRSHDGGRTWQMWEVDTEEGPYNYWPDLVYSRRPGRLRLLAQPLASGELRVYTFAFRGPPG